MLAKSKISLPLLGSPIVRKFLPSRNHYNLATGYQLITVPTLHSRIYKRPAIILTDSTKAANSSTQRVRNFVATSKARARPVTDSFKPPASTNDVYVALGSNVGDRLEAIESACRDIDKDGDMHILETSPLYETEPMYVEDQDRFLNGVARIETRLQPFELLDKLQAIESSLGRVKTVEKGPRNIDLDIISYNDIIVKTDRLALPHHLMLEREFVLRPLCE